MYVCIYVYMYIYIYIYMYICIYVCMCVCMYIYRLIAAKFSGQHPGSFIEPHELQCFLFFIGSALWNVNCLIACSLSFVYTFIFEE